jgi:hypothetical protein
MATTFVVEDVLSRVQQLTEELNQTRREICDHVFTDEEPDDGSLYSRSSHSLEAMSRFKEALDDARHVVWLYLEAVAERPVASVDRQRRLLARANEILGALSHRPPLPTPDRPSGERSLMDRLLQLIDNRIEPARVVRPDPLPRNGC